MDTLNFFNNWIGYVAAEGWLKERKSYWFVNQGLGITDPVIQKKGKITAMDLILLTGIGAVAAGLLYLAAQKAQYHWNWQAIPPIPAADWTKTPANGFPV